MPDKDDSQTDVIEFRVERYFGALQSTLDEHCAEFGRRVNSWHAELQVKLQASSAEITQHERKHTAGFNAFDYIEPDENRLSDILAELLKQKGSHGQGGIFLKLLLDRIKVEIPTESRTAKVHREEATAYLADQLRRIDILVDFGTFGFGIENKPWAGEQVDQVQSYLLHLDRQYSGNFLLLYLSGSGEPPLSVSKVEHQRRENQNQFRLLDYRNGLAAWLEDCIKHCEAERIRWFLQDFRAYVMAEFGESDFVDRG